MKLYCLVNVKCCAIQAGIQALHSTARMMHKYHMNGQAWANLMIDTWMTHNETVVLLQGGVHKTLRDKVNLLNGQEVMPFDFFTEEDINDAYTSISILCSTEMVEDMKRLREEEVTKEDLAQNYSSGSAAEMLEFMAFARTIS